MTFSQKCVPGFPICTSPTRGTQERMTTEHGAVPAKSLRSQSNPTRASSVCKRKTGRYVKPII